MRLHLLLCISVASGLLIACGDDPAPAGCTTDSECRGGRACIAGSCTEPPDVGDLDTGEDEPDQGGADVVPDVEPDEGMDVPELPDDDVPDVQPDTNDADAPDVDDVDAQPDVEEDAPDIPLEPAALFVAPAGIDFGEVGLFVSTFRSLTLRNEGGEDLTISSVHLQTAQSSGFQLVPPESLPIVLAGGEAVQWQVRFQPTALRGDRPTRYGNFIIVEASDRERGVEVPLEGLAVPDPAACLTFDQRGVDIGYISPNNVRSVRLELRNCGTDAIDVDEVGLQDLPETLLTLGSPAPLTLAPGATVAVVATYTPSEVREVRGRIVATAGDIEAVTTIVGGPECPTAVATARSGEQGPGERIGALLGARVELSGLDSEDPTEGELSYAWAIDAPEGSTELGVEPGLESAGLVFVPDVVGTYRVRLRVTSRLSGLESCDESVAYVDVFPETPQIDVRLTWNNRADLDLHLVRRVDGQWPAFGRGQEVAADDCYFNNLNPNWGDRLSRVDDPRHLGDDTDGDGPERIVYPRLDPDRQLRVGINYARRRETESSEATVVVLVNGEEAGSYTMELTEQGSYWIPVLIDGDGTISEP